MRTGAWLIAILMATTAPAPAQDARIEVDTDLEALPPPSPAPALRVAETAAGRVGERRTRAQVEGVQPMARINNRIQNRVQARIRNRIDRNYDPIANATSPFAVAGEAIQRSSQQPRR